MAKTRTIKIEAKCDRCNDLHVAEGLGGIFAILEKPNSDGRSFVINTGCYSIHNSEELVNLLYRLLQTVTKNDPAAAFRAVSAYLAELGVKNVEILKDENKKERTIN